MDEIQEFVADRQYARAITRPAEPVNKDGSPSHQIPEGRERKSGGPSSISQLRASSVQSVASSLEGAWPKLPKEELSRLPHHEYMAGLQYDEVFGTPVGRFFLILLLLRDEGVPLGSRLREDEVPGVTDALDSLEAFYMEQQIDLPTLRRYVTKLETLLPHVDRLAAFAGRLRASFDGLELRLSACRAAAAAGSAGRGATAEGASTLRKSMSHDLVGLRHQQAALERGRQALPGAAGVKGPDPRTSFSIRDARHKSADSATAAPPPIVAVAVPAEGAPHCADSRCANSGLSPSELEAQLQREYAGFFEGLLASARAWFEEAFGLLRAHPTLCSAYRRVRWNAVEKKMKLKDFVVYRDLGRGAFGVVSGARHRATGRLVAVKAMNRRLVKGKGALRCVAEEYSILKRLGSSPSPCCVSLLYAFKDDANFYLVLPLLTGGDLGFHIKKRGCGFPEPEARFFAAQILLGLRHMHSLGILYRDLKPENVLLDDAGHVQISDMGLAMYVGFTPATIGQRLVQGKAGTPGYWCPEMIRSEAFGFDADYWSFAVTLYEILAGECPFSATRCGMDRNSATTTARPTFPAVESQPGGGGGRGAGPFPTAARDLIQLMLVRSRLGRLGSQPDAAERIRGHHFFAGVDWAALENRDVDPPFVPPRNVTNAQSQADLDARNKEATFKHIALSDADDIPRFEFKARQHLVDTVSAMHTQRHLNDSKGDVDRDRSSKACAIL